MPGKVPVLVLSRQHCPAAKSTDAGEILIESRICFLPLAFLLNVGASDNKKRRENANKSRKQLQGQLINQRSGFKVFNTSHFLFAHDPQRSATCRTQKDAIQERTVQKLSDLNFHVILADKVRATTDDLSGSPLQRTLNSIY